MQGAKSQASPGECVKGHANTNFSTMRRSALSLLRREPTAKVGIKNKRLTAAWDETYLEKVLFTK